MLGGPLDGKEPALLAGSKETARLRSSAMPAKGALSRRSFYNFDQIKNTSCLARPASFDKRRSDPHRDTAARGYRGHTGDVRKHGRLPTISKASCLYIAG